MKLGLKLWSINTDYYLEEAKKLFKQNVYDYIELYIIPDSTSSLKQWKKLKSEFNIPFAIHAPHSVHGVNLANKDYEKINMKIFTQVKEFSKELDSLYVVIHSGTEGSIEETIRQLNIIKPTNMLIENKPYIGPLDNKERCVGCTIEEIKKVINNVNCGFCLDLGHAICTYNSLKKIDSQNSFTRPYNFSPYEFINEFNKLNPACYHLSDNYIETEIDNHMHFGKGNYDLNKFFDIINVDKYIAIETEKNSKRNLNDFIQDSIFIKKLYEENCNG